MPGGSGSVHLGGPGGKRSVNPLGILVIGLGIVIIIIGVKGSQHKIKGALLGQS